ncbi:sensor histidine kinase [Desulfofundulus thermobenzoicus]|nr:ATP-binding protein [Desulfofundulus thermobenzoicus]
MSLFSLLLVSLPEALLVTMLGFQLAGLKVTPRHLISIGAAQTVSSYFIRLSPSPFGLHTLVQVTVYILILRIITGLSWRRVAVIALLGLVVYGTLEAAILPPLLSITGYTLEEVIATDYMRIAVFLPEAVLILLFIISCRRYNFHLLDFASGLNQLALLNDTGKRTEKAYLNLYILLLLPLLLLAVLNMVLFVSQTGAFPKLYPDMFVASFNLILVAVAVLSMGARKQRHDFNHHLQTVYGLLEVGSCDEARRYVKEMFLDISNPAEVVKTDNPGISAMLFAKAGLAEARGINFSVQVDCSLQNIPLTPMEASSLLGNLLDNAIKAAGAFSGGQRHVRLEITREPGEYVFTVANTGDPMPPEMLERMYGPHYATGKNNQGLGLAIVKEIVEKHSGRITVEHAGNETIFSVHILDKGAGRS